MGCPKTSLRNYHYCCAITQKSVVLISEAKLLQRMLPPPCRSYTRLQNNTALQEFHTMSAEQLCPIGVPQTSAEQPCPGGVPHNVCGTTQPCGSSTQRLQNNTALYAAMFDGLMQYTRYALAFCQSNTIAVSQTLQVQWPLEVFMLGQLYLWTSVYLACRTKTLWS